MGKIYARQVNPEYQESPLFIGGAADFWPEEVIVTGNREYRGRTTDEWDALMERLEDAAHDYDWCQDPVNREEYPEEIQTVPEILDNWRFSKRGGKPWTDEEIEEWKELLENPDTSDNETMVQGLSLLTGKAYDCTMIRGCCQGDWQYMYYPVSEWDSEAIEEFESEYFNTGSEWCINSDGYEPYDPESEDPESMDGFWAYTCKWDDEDIKRWIGEMVGANPEDVVLYKWVGRRYTNVYETF